MASFIGIGFVYKNYSTQFIEQELKKIIDYFKNCSCIIKNIKVCKNKDGTNWIETGLLHFPELDKWYYVLSAGYFGQIEMQCDFLGKKNLSFTIRIEKTDQDYFGILIDIPEEKLLGIGIVNIEQTTETIIQFMKEIYEMSRFEYSFCDNEAEIKYSPQEFLSLKKNVYSIAVIANSDAQKLVIIKSEWNIDGLTKRTF